MTLSAHAADLERPYYARAAELEDVARAFHPVILAVRKLRPKPQMDEVPSSDDKPSEATSCSQGPPRAMGRRR